MNKLILVANRTKDAEGKEIALKTAAALALKVPVFKGAEIKIGYENAKAELEGMVVLAEWLPNNLVAVTETFIECPSDVDDDIREYLSPEKLASKMKFINVFQVEHLNTKKFIQAMEKEEAETTALGKMEEDEEAEARDKEVREEEQEALETSAE